MCLATAFGNKEDESEMLCKNVTRIYVDGKSIRLETIMGDEIKVEGSIKFIDLMENKVIIDID